MNPVSVITLLIKHLVKVIDHMKEDIMMMEIIISVMLLLVGIVVLIIIHVCIVGRAFRRGFGDGFSAPNIRGAGVGGLTPQDLSKLPCFEYKGVEKGSNNITTTSECAVCLDGFKVGDKCRVLPTCHHCFHASCVDLWLIKSPFCPICRASTRPPLKVCSDVAEGSHV